MSDILYEAENMCTGVYSIKERSDLVPGLVEEIKRLREIQEVGLHAISVGGKTFLSIDVDEKRLEQLAAKDALINQLRDRCWKAEQEVSQLQASKTGIMLTYDPTGPVTFNGIEYVPREEALAEPHDGDLTAAYVLGSQKANERLKVLQEYVGRLEKEFLDLKTNSCFVAHANGVSEDEIVAYKQKIAQDTLGKIRKG